MTLRRQLYEKISDIKDITVLSPIIGPLASPILTVLLPENIERTAFVKMLLDKHQLSIRPTHKEFGFNGIRFSIHFFNSEQEIDKAGDVLRQELIR